MTNELLAKFKELEELAAKRAEPKPENNKVAEFFNFLSKVNKAKAEPQSEDADPCLDDLGDCKDVKCPDCEGSLSTVSFSLPVQVECQECERVFKLRELIMSEKD